MIAERFWARVRKADEPACWVWIGAKDSNGYGQVYDREAGRVRHLLAHRVAYEMMVGPIPGGLVLDHLCRNTKCVNPRHLEPVTNAENILRGQGQSALHRAATHCKHGHRFDTANTYVITRRGRQNRGCKTCVAARSRATYLRNKAKKAGAA